MDYIWKRNWAGRYFMHVRVSPFYKDYMAQKIQDTDLSDEQTTRMNALRDYLRAMELLDEVPHRRKYQEYKALEKQASINSALRRESLEADYHIREQEQKLGMRKRNRWALHYQNKDDY